MRRLSLALSLALALPLSARAEDPLSAEAFDTAVTGRTLTYATPSGPYGIERYLPGRRVIWGFVGDDTCYEGEWFPQNGAICFTYDTIGQVQCWQFFARDGGLAAEYLGDGSLLFEMAEDGLPLICGGVGA